MCLEGQDRRAHFLVRVSMAGEHLGHNESLNKKRASYMLVDLGGAPCDRLVEQVGSSVVKGYSIGLIVHKDRYIIVFKRFANLLIRGI